MISTKMIWLLTNDCKSSADRNGWAGIDLADVDSCVRLSDVSELEVVGVPVVRAHRDPVVLGDDVRVNSQSSLFRMQPRNLEKKICAFLSLMLLNGPNTIVTK